MSPFCHAELFSDSLRLKEPCPWKFIGISRLPLLEGVIAESVRCSRGSLLRVSRNEKTYAERRRGCEYMRRGERSLSA